MNPVRVSVLISLLLLCLPVGATPAQDMVDAWLVRPELKGVSIGVSVRDVATGQRLAEHKADRLMNPASGTKLLTTSAALLLLGPDHRWRTRLLVDRQTLRLVGGGDPALLDDGIQRLAAAGAQALGSVELRRLVVDTSRHDEQRIPPAFEQKDTDAYYRPAVGPAGSHYGAVEVTVQPSQSPGRPLKVAVTLGGTGVEIVNTARTVFEFAPDTPPLKLGTEEGEAGTTRVLISGAMVVDDKARKVRLRVPDPDRFTGYLLRDALCASGLVAQGAPVVLDPVVSPEVAGREVMVHESPPLSEIVRDINVWSNNYMAEALMKELSLISSGSRDKGEASVPLQPVGLSWADGARSATRALIDLGLSAQEIRFVNGSGLYQATHVSAGAITRLVVRMVKHPTLGETFRDSLGLAGGEGWLRHRLTGPRTRKKVRAKTGTLDEVVSLSGLIPTTAGAEVAFSILINDATPRRTRKLRRAMDALVTELAQLR